MEPDFTGWATKANLKCSDGRVIMDDAFKHQDTQQVPLVWSHYHDDPENILGHAILEAKEGSMRVKAFLNGTPRGRATKLMLQHGDIDSLSIWANSLSEKILNGAKQVFHGMIKEVSLVIAGANPGAKIDFVNLAHADGSTEELDDTAIITTGEKIELFHSAESSFDHANVEEVWNSMSDVQRNLVDMFVEEALKHSDEDDKKEDEKTSEEDEKSDDDKKDESSEEDQKNDNTNEGDLNKTEGTDDVKHNNVFEQAGSGSGSGTAVAFEGAPVLSHADWANIVDKAKQGKMSLKAAAMEYASQHQGAKDYVMAHSDMGGDGTLAHGITELEILFPDARAVGTTPEWYKRRTEWVTGVLNNVVHLPYSRIKTRSADITQEEARAKGYIKGALKKEEFFGVTQRSTTPTTVYKKQKLDRDDIIDITDFNVVAWMKGEMRMMLEEELARAILVGDGREIDDEDKIKDPAGNTSGEGIRSILNDHEMYTSVITVNIGDANSKYSEITDLVILERSQLKGTGRPTFYTTQAVLSRMLLERDGMGRRLYRNVSELAEELQVDSIVPVEVMEDTAYANMVGILVNLVDYAVGTDAGGEVSLFDDFDIDYNQYKYLIETRLSGTLTKLKAAQKVLKTASANALVAPVEPTFDQEENELTIVNQTGVVYKHGATVINAAGSPYTVTGTWIVDATPASGYYFASSDDDQWTYHAED